MGFFEFHNVLLPDEFVIVILLSSVVTDDRRLFDALFRFACCGAAELFGCDHKVKTLFFSNNVALRKSEVRTLS